MFEEPLLPIEWRRKGLKTLHFLFLFLFFFTLFLITTFMFRKSTSMSHNFKVLSSEAVAR